MACAAVDSHNQTPLPTEPVFSNYLAGAPLAIQQSDDTFWAAVLDGFDDFDGNGPFQRTDGIADETQAETAGQSHYSQDAPFLEGVVPPQNSIRYDKGLESEVNTRGQHLNLTDRDLGSHGLDGQQKARTTRSKREAAHMSNASGRSTSGKSKRRKKKRRSAKFSSGQTMKLQSWIDSHIANPYPDEAEKKCISAETSLSIRQIEAWFARTRQRKFPSHSAALTAPGKINLNTLDCVSVLSSRDSLSDGSEPETADLNIEPELQEDIAMSLEAQHQAEELHSSEKANPQLWEQFNVLSANGQPQETRRSPLDRYLSASPDREAVDEGAMETLMHEAIESIQNDVDHLGPKIARIEHATPAGSSIGPSAGLSVGSVCSFASFGPRKGRRRNYVSQSMADHSHAPCGMTSQDCSRSQEQQTEPISPQKKRKSPVYQCTFCSKGFRKKYEWKRHQESTHAPAREWTCLPPELRSPSIFNPCIFCRQRHKNFQDFEKNHRVSSCLVKGQVDRTFFRKDHLVQHVRRAHCDGMTTEQVQSLDLTSWSRPAYQLDLPCGFCGFTPHGYDNRMQHISKHFEDGLDMASWTFTASPEGRPGRTQDYWSCLHLLSTPWTLQFRALLELCVDEGWSSRGFHGPHQVVEPDWNLRCAFQRCAEPIQHFTSPDEFKRHLVASHWCKDVPELALLVFLCARTWLSPST